MAGCTVLLGASRVTLLEIIEAEAFAVTGVTGQVLVRFLQGESTRGVPWIPPHHVLAMEILVLFGVAQHACILTDLRGGGGAWQGRQEGLGMRASMALGTSAPWDVQGDVAECFHRGGGGWFMAGVAVEIRMGTMQGNLGGVREGMQVVEGMLLTMAGLAGTLHGPFMGIIMALDAILSEGLESWSTLLQHLGVGIAVAVDAGQAVVATVEMELHALVSEILDPRKVGLREAERDQGIVDAIEMFRVA